MVESMHGSTGLLIAIPGFPDYFATCDGRVFSRKRELKQLKPILHASGYLVLNLIVAGKTKRKKIHQLICETFHGAQPTPRHQVRHLDGSKRNNHANNLAWGTALDDANDRRRHGTLTRGERCHSARLNESQVRAIRERFKRNARLCDIVNEFNIGYGAAAKVRDRKSWRHVSDE